MRARRNESFLNYRFIGLLKDVCGSVKDTISSAADITQAGTRAPNFTLPSQEDNPVSLTDYRGNWGILYFYSKDQTTGCTIEAYNFQRDISTTVH